MEEAKKQLLFAYSKADLRKLYARGIKSIKIPIIEGSAFLGTYKDKGSYDFPIIELLSA